MKRERLIRRYKHNHFRGSVVAVKRRGRRWTKYFSDRPDGRLEALRRARGYRDALLQGLKAWERPSGVTTRKIMFMIPAGSGGKIIPRGAQ
jgi:hypothetical protein